MFYVGQKVVCIDDSPGVWTKHRELSKGAIYTVRGIDCDTPRHVGIYLEEINLGPHPSAEFPNTELSFKVERFRPLNERKTNISIFTAMLDPARINEPVE